MLSSENHKMTVVEQRLGKQAEGSSVFNVFGVLEIMEMGRQKNTMSVFQDTCKFCDLPRCAQSTY